ncbi:MAG: hydrogen peroxide-inducible genes activator [Bacteriovoracaceae bacterium]|jgi:LysR family hydrogen peroxide-inducible transcriptional activator|nr:hydrogen peroxide-inducible genes activator [Bacteriovoracaceae bacterium]
MTLTQLEYVLAVAKYKHFGRAADSCYVTQPTLSMQIQKLEEELQIIIFDRSHSPIKLTVEGEQILDQAKRVVSEHKKIYTIIEQNKDEVSGDFKLAVIPTLSPFIIPLFLQSFVARYPKVNIEIVEHTTDEIITLVKDDLVDAALLVTPLYEKNIIEKVLYFEPFYLFASNGHPLGKKSKVKQEDLDINDIWLLNKGNCFRDQVLNICSQNKNKKVTNPINFESGNFETLKNMVLSGCGYTLLPQMAVDALNKKHKNLVREFSKPIPTREVSLIHSKHSVKNKILDALEEEILSYIPENLIEFNQKKQEVIDI